MANVLIVDDDLDIADASKDLLELAVAHSANDARQRLLDGICGISMAAILLYSLGT